MAINVLIRDRFARITLSDRLEFAMHRDFKAAYAPLLEHTDISEIEIEMAKVNHLDSAAMGMMMILNERVKDAGKSISLVNVSDYVDQVFIISNFDKIFNFKNVP